MTDGLKENIEPIHDKAGMYLTLDERELLLKNGNNNTFLQVLKSATNLFPNDANGNKSPEHHSVYLLGTNENEPIGEITTFYKTETPHINPMSERGFVYLVAGILCHFDAQAGDNPSTKDFSDKLSDTWQKTKLNLIDKEVGRQTETAINFLANKIYHETTWKEALGEV